MRTPLALLVLLSACAAEHSVQDAPDAAAPDAAAPDTWAPCPPDLVDEGDACVGWRTLPSPPCVPETLVLCGAEVAVTCEGATFALGDGRTWDQSSEVSGTVPVEGPGLAELPIGPAIFVTLAQGRVATHGDVYAHPAAWRTDASGAWRETVPPPSAFLTSGAALSDHEALFVGRDAFVFTWLAH